MTWTKSTTNSTPYSKSSGVSTGYSKVGGSSTNYIKQNIGFSSIHAGQPIGLLLILTYALDIIGNLAVYNKGGSSSTSWAKQ